MCGVSAARNMVVTALCIRLSMTVLVLLVSHVELSYSYVSDAAFRIIPTRLQLYEYESVSFTCEGVNGSAGWSVRSIKEFIPKCSNGILTSTLICTIDFALESDSGGYWCEGEGGERSNTVNVTVTGGPVILQSPALPVMEGAAVTLSCRNKMNTSNIPADFYKDGLPIGSRSTGNITIENVSKSHDGFYKCHISGAGESPESHLAVRGKHNRGDGASVILESPALPVVEGKTVTLHCKMKETSADLKADFYKNGHFMLSSNSTDLMIHSVSKSDEGLYKCRISGAGESAESWLSIKATYKEIHVSRHHYILLWIVITVILVLQLLVIGLLYWKKQLVLLQAKMEDPNSHIYTVVKKDKKKKEAADTADILSLCLDTSHSAKPQTATVPEPGLSGFTVTTVPSTAIDPHLTDEDCEYASIEEVGE